MARKISHLHDGHKRLERSMSTFWIENGISFPWSFNLYLYCCNGAGVHIQNCFLDGVCPHNVNCREVSSVLWKIFASDYVVNERERRSL